MQWGAWQTGSSAWGNTASNPRLSQFEKQKMRREREKSCLLSFPFLQLGLKSLFLPRVMEETLPGCFRRRGSHTPLQPLSHAQMFACSKIHLLCK